MPCSSASPTALSIGGRLAWTSSPTPPRSGSARLCTRCAQSRRRRSRRCGAPSERARCMSTSVSSRPRTRWRRRSTAGRRPGCSPIMDCWGRGPRRCTRPTSPDADVADLGESRTTVCICPTTERDLADGIGPARALAEAGCALSLGSDQNAVIDPFEELRGLEMHDRLVARERGRFTPTELITAAASGRLPQPGLGGGRDARRRGAGRLRRGPDRLGPHDGHPAGPDRVRRNGRRCRSGCRRRPDGRPGRRAPARIGVGAAERGSRPARPGSAVTSTLITGIGELVTCDGDECGPARAAGMRRRGRRGRPGRLDRAVRAGAGRRSSSSTWRDAR